MKQSLVPPPGEGLLLSLRRSLSERYQVAGNCMTVLHASPQARSYRNAYAIAERNRFDRALDASSPGNTTAIHNQDSKMRSV